MKQWYVIKTKPKQEKAVQSHLAGADYEVFLPQIEGIHVPQPLFPAYLFVAGDLRDPRHHRLVRFTRGVSTVLGDASGPIPIAGEIIAALKEQTRDGSLIAGELLFKEGESVRVRRGVLKDLVGIIKRHLPGQQRVELLFSWWTTSMQAKIKYSDLEKAA